MQETTDYAVYGFWIVGKQTGMRRLRDATEDEMRAYSALASDLQPYEANVHRFDRVLYHYNELLDFLQLRHNTKELEEQGDVIVGNYLYAFCEFLDHWKTHISHLPSGDRRNQLQHRFEELCSREYDANPDYALAIILRNYRHQGRIVHGSRDSLAGGPELLCHRDVILQSNAIRENKKRIVREYPSSISLESVIRSSYESLWTVQRELIFFGIPDETVHRAVEAWQQKRRISHDDEALVIGRLVQVEEEQDLLSSCAAVMDEETPIDGVGLRIRFEYLNDVPWGVGQLLHDFYGFL